MIVIAPVRASLCPQASLWEEWQGLPKAHGQKVLIVKVGAHMVS